jgi:hypothetical protein
MIDRPAVDSGRCQVAVEHFRITKSELAVGKLFSDSLKERKNLYILPGNYKDSYPCEKQSF